MISVAEESARRQAQEAELAELRDQARTLEEEVTSLRRKLADAPKRVRTLGGATPRGQGPAGPGGVAEREALLHPAGGARAHRRAPRGGRQADPAAVGLRRGGRQERRRHHRRPLQRAQDARRPPPRDRRRRAAAGPGGRAQRELQRDPGPPARRRRRGGHAEGGHGRRRAGHGRRPGRRGAGLRAVRRPARRAAALGRHAADGRALRPPARAAAPPRGGGPAARGGARHHLRRRRRPRRADRGHRRRRRAALPVPGAVRRTPPAGAEGHPALRPAWLRQDAHRQGRGQLAGSEGGRHHGRGQGPQLLHQHQGPGAAQQVRRRDRAPDPPGVPAGQGEERGGLAGHRVLRRDGLDVPHAWLRHLLRHGVDDRAPAAGRDRRRRGPEERHRDRRHEP